MLGRIRKILALTLDPRVLVGLGGVLLSVVMHELLHVVMHWGDIQQVGLFPDRHAIFEIIFEPSTVYDLAIEEGFAYTVTMATIILTAMLVSDIHEARDKRGVQQIIFTNNTSDQYANTQNKNSRERLARILGIKS